MDHDFIYLLIDSYTGYTYTYRLHSYLHCSCLAIFPGPSYLVSYYLPTNYTPFPLRSCNFTFSCLSKPSLAITDILHFVEYIHAHDPATCNVDITGAQTEHKDRSDHQKKGRDANKVPIWRKNSQWDSEMGARQHVRQRRRDSDVTGDPFRYIYKR